MAKKEKKEETVVKEIKEDIKKIKKTIVDKTPKHFSSKDIVNAIFGALLIGLTFALKGAVIMTAISLYIEHIIAIIFSTLLILTAQTYFIAYAKVKDKEHRKSGQFIIKRVGTMYIVAIFVSFYLVYIFGINNQNLIGNSPVNVLKLVVLISMPCAVGAAIPSLLKREE